MASRNFQATVRWRGEQRWRALHRVLEQSADLRWSPTLVQLLLDELVIGDDLRLLIESPAELPVRRYPQAVAVALAVRYSYRKDLLRSFTRRLRLVPRDR